MQNEFIYHIAEKSIWFEAQNKGEKSAKSSKERAVERLLRSITKRLKLAKEHPKVVAEFKRIWDHNKLYF